MAQLSIEVDSTVSPKTLLPPDREQLQLLSDTRVRTLALVDGLSQEDLDRRPAPGKWSVGEVLDHVLRAEGFVRGELRQLVALARSDRPSILRRSFAEVDISMASIPKPLLSLFETPISLLGRFVPTSLRELILRYRLIPAQNPSFATPERGRKGEDLRLDLAVSLEQTRGIVEQNADLDYRQLILQHPILGRNDVAGLLRFLALHEQRHQDQIRAAL